MPNWNFNLIEFNNPEDAKRVQEFMKSEECDFDFNQLVPMPEELNIETGSSSDLGALLAFSDIVQSEGRISKEMRSLGRQCSSRCLEQALREAGEDVEKFSKIVQENIENSKVRNQIGDADEEEWLNNLRSLGRKAISNVKEFGYANWYDWADAKWGTKWNASDVKFDERSIFFENPWGPPEQIYMALFKQFPEIPIKITYAEEQQNCFGGQWEYDGNGTIAKRETFDSYTLEAFSFYDHIFPLGEGEEYRLNGSLPTTKDDYERFNGTKVDEKYVVDPPFEELPPAPNFSELIDAMDVKTVKIKS